MISFFHFESTSPFPQWAIHRRAQEAIIERSNPPKGLNPREFFPRLCALWLFLSAFRAEPYNCRQRGAAVNAAFERLRNCSRCCDRGCRDPADRWNRHLARFSTLRAPLEREDQYKKDNNDHDDQRYPIVLKHRFKGRDGLELSHNGSHRAGFGYAKSRNNRQ